MDIRTYCESTGTQRISDGEAGLLGKQKYKLQVREHEEIIRDEEVCRVKWKYALAEMQNHGHTKGEVEICRAVKIWSVSPWPSAMEVVKVVCYIAGMK